jgi:hypothetical protein
LKPFTPNTPISFPHSFAELTSFCGTGSICGGLQMFFKLQKERNNVWGFYFLWVIDCLLTSLLPSWEVWGALALVENGDKPMRVYLFFTMKFFHLCQVLYDKMTLEIEISCSQWEDSACTRGYNFFFFILRKGGWCLSVLNVFRSGPKGFP